MGHGLLRAVKAGDVAAVAKALALGDSIEKTDWAGYTPLNQAAMDGCLPLVQLLVAKGANLEPKTCSVTPLILAARHARAPVVQFLLDKGANTDARDKDGKTARDHGNAAVRAIVDAAVAQRAAPPARTAAQVAGDIFALADRAEAERKARVEAERRQPRQQGEAAAQAESSSAGEDATAASAAAGKDDPAAVAQLLRARQDELLRACNLAPGAADAEWLRDSSGLLAPALAQLEQLQQLLHAGVLDSEEHAASRAAKLAALCAEAAVWELTGKLNALMDARHALTPAAVPAAGKKLVDKACARAVPGAQALVEQLLRERRPELHAAGMPLAYAAVRSGGAAERLAPAVSLHAAPAASVRALVIGIDAYADPVPGRLSNAVHDAEAVYAQLRKLPGATVSLVTNCGRAELEAALLAFRDGGMHRGMAVTPGAAQQRTLGLVFFAGHGLQVSGRNYLVPADFVVPTQNDKLDVMLKDTARRCVSLDAVEEIMDDAGVFAGCVLLDCCRNVPDFLAAVGGTRAVGGARSLPAGLSDASPRLKDLMVTFATAPGAVALDRSTLVPGHSPFTAALLTALQAPRALIHLNPFLTDAVAADTQGRQRPHVGGSYGTEAGSLVLG